MKLDDIESRLREDLEWAPRITALTGADALPDYLQDMTWLIARVRRLEAAIRENNRDNCYCQCHRCTELREALKEE